MSASAMVDRVKSVADVVQTIPSGVHIALGGFSIARDVIPVVHELIRQQRRDLTISQTASHFGGVAPFARGDRPEMRVSVMIELSRLHRFIPKARKDRDL